MVKFANLSIFIEIKAKIYIRGTNDDIPIMKTILFTTRNGNTYARGCDIKYTH